MQMLRGKTAFLPWRQATRVGKHNSETGHGTNRKLTASGILESVLVQGDANDQSIVSFLGVNGLF